METPIVPSKSELTSSVYEPAEDSFLLLDALEQDLPKFISSLECFDTTQESNLQAAATTNVNLNTIGDAIFALEVGCGSGIISTAISKFDLLRPFLPVVFAVDLNPAACLLTQATAKANLAGNKVEPILLDGVLSSSYFRLPFDLIICNPPYVPICSEENPEDKDSGLLEKSWSGGPDGNTFITPFLSSIGNILSDRGVLYLLLSSWNDPAGLVEKVAKPNGLKGQLILKRAAGRERLSVWKFSKN